MMSPSSISVGTTPIRIDLEIVGIEMILVFAEIETDVLEG